MLHPTKPNSTCAKQGVAPTLHLNAHKSLLFQNYSTTLFPHLFYLLRDTTPSRNNHSQLCFFSSWPRRDSVVLAMTHECMSCYFFLCDCALLRGKCSKSWVVVLSAYMRRLHLGGKLHSGSALYYRSLKTRVQYEKHMWTNEVLQFSLKWPYWGRY